MSRWQDLQTAATAALETAAGLAHGPADATLSDTPRVRDEGTQRPARPEPVDAAPTGLGVTPAMPAHVRASNYFLQTGSPELTARQARRLRHKLNRELRQAALRADVRPAADATPPVPAAAAHLPRGVVGRGAAAG